MTREAHAVMLATLLEAAADKSTASDLLTQLSDDYAALLATAALADGEVKRLAGENARLVEQNMRLFLKVGEVPDKEPEKPEENPTGLTFDGLYQQLGIATPEDE